MKERITVTLDPEIIEWAQTQAKKLDRSVSWIVNQACKNQKKQSSTNNDSNQGHYK